MRRFRGTVAVVLVALAVAACGTPVVDTAPQLSSLALEIARLREQKLEVAEAQRHADDQLRGVLDAVRELDQLVAGMRDADTLDAARGSWPAVESAADAAVWDDLRQPLFALARRVDTARTTLGRARDEVTEDWEREYLAAEDEVLIALRAYAEAADALAQVLVAHRETYEAVLEGSRVYFETRQVFRTDEEAIQAYEVRVGARLDALATAQREIAEFRTARQAAAIDVNAASDRAASAWERRPTDAPTGAGGAGT